ncbi:uncharacterized protein LODBEIA_P13710 [Lodderomyces beijingensis]|uniref:Ran-specific GTPase-activating protein 30 n=1 Tax=Lodderomyces beijingensis TaxID=1775926 RepID=A0ABP0ZI76_9ASCO
MDQILAKASNQAISFAIRSGITLASGYAIKTVSTFLDKIPESAQRRIALKRTKLNTKIAIISVTIDLIRLSAARGNTVLESSLALIDDLDRQFTEFDASIDAITRGLNRGNEKESIVRVESVMDDLIAEINDAIPVLNLSLLSSGVNLHGGGVSLRHVSPGRLLQASNYVVNRALGGIVGPVFDLVTYTVFYNPSRMKYVDDGGADELSCITWKETYARSSVRIVDGGGDGAGNNFRYSLEIEEDFSDGRYHDDTDKPGLKSYDLQTVQSMFFTASGKLLRIEGRNSPVLILKMVDREKKSEEWIALGELNKGEFDEDDEDDEDEDEEEKKEAKVDAEAVKASSLSLLEYIIRLSRLQEIEQKSILEIPDEVLKLYLHDQSTSADLPKSIAQKQKHETTVRNTEDSIRMDSNVSRLKHLNLDETKKEKEKEKEKEKKSKSKR